MCIAWARHEQLERDKVVSKRSSWHRRSNLFALLHWILQSTKCHELECWPSRPSDQGRILFQTRETRSTAGFDRNIRHGLRGFREWNTKRKTRLETTSTESTVQPCPTRNSSLSHLTRRQKRTKSKGALHKAMVFYVFTKKTPKKKPVQRVQPNSRCCSRSCWTDHCVSQLCTLQSKLHRRAYWGFNANWSRVAKPPCNLPLNFSYDIFFGQCMFGRLHPILRSLG